MNYKVVKLDGRYSYSANFRWCLEFTRRDWKGTGVLDFDRARRWMNETWGWSQDVDTMTAMARELNKKLEPWDDIINRHWAYSVKYRDYRIYLASDKELAWFTLKHPAEQ